VVGICFVWLRVVLRRFDLDRCSVAISATHLALESSGGVESPVGLDGWRCAGVRNFELQANGRAAVMGIWHCQVLASEVIEAAVRSKGGLFGSGEGPSAETMVRLMIGDPWSGGARTEMVVPLSKRDEVPGIGELCDLLVLSKNSDFRDFKVSGWAQL